MAAAASVTGLVTWARSLVRSPGPGGRLSLAGPRPEAATIPVNRSLRDHGNGLGRGARGGGGGGSLVAGRDGGAAAAAVAVAPVPALSIMRRSSPDQEPAAGWEADAAAAAAAAESLAAEAGEQLGVDAGAAGEPEHPEREEQPKAVGPTPTPARRRAPEEGDARVVRRLPPALPMAPSRPAARALSQLVRARGRSRGRSYRRSSGSVRPVTVDSSKARTSLDALKISLRQLRWKEVRPAGPARGHRGVVPRPGPGATSQVRSARPYPAPLTALQPWPLQAVDPGFYGCLLRHWPRG